MSSESITSSSSSLPSANAKSSIIMSCIGDERGEGLEGGAIRGEGYGRLVVCSVRERGGGRD